MGTSIAADARVAKERALNRRDRALVAQRLATSEVERANALRELREAEAAANHAERLLFKHDPWYRYQREREQERAEERQRIEGILAGLASGETYKAVAERYGISQSAVAKAARAEIWSRWKATWAPRQKKAHA